MAVGAVSIRMPTPFLGTLIGWWRRGATGCAFGEVRADTIEIRSLQESGPCVGALGEIVTSPPVSDEDQLLRRAYIQWVLERQPDLLFYWVVHDTMTVRGVLVPRILGVRRGHMPVVGS